MIMTQKAEKRMKQGYAITRFWPMTSPMKAESELLAIATGWAGYEIPDIKELVFLGKANLAVIYQNHMTTSRELRKHRRKLKETVERLKDTSALRLKARMKSYTMCDFVGEDYGKLAPGEIEDLSLKQIQERQSRNARKIRRGCRFGPFVSKWCVRSPHCRTLKSNGGKGCEMCGYCKEGSERPICIFATIQGGEMLRNCIARLDTDLSYLDVAIQKIDEFLKRLRIARKKAEAKRSVFAIWRQCNHFRVGDRVVVAETSQPRSSAQLATVKAFQQLVSTAQDGLRIAVIVQTDDGEKLTIPSRSPEIMLEEEYYYFLKHRNYAKLWALA